MVTAAHRLAQLAGELLGDPGAHRHVQLAPVGEVPVDDGLARARLGSDLLHAHAGAVPAHRDEGGVHQLLAAGAAVLVPPRVAAVPPAHRLGFSDTDGT